MTLLMALCRRSSQKKKRHSSSILQRVSFSRLKEENEIPLVPLEERAAGQPDAISESEMVGFRGQILNFSKERKKSVSEMVSV